MSATIAEVLKKSGTVPYSRPLKVKVVASQQPLLYRSKEGEEKKCLNCVVSDGESLVKVTVYDPCKFPKFMKGNTIIVREIIKKSEAGTSSSLSSSTLFVVTKTTKVFLTSSIEIGDALVAEGENILNPPPSPTVTLQEALRSPQKTKISIKGKVVSEEAIRMVSVRGADVPIKTLHLADESTDTCKVTLWRETTAVEVRPGDFIAVTDVVVNTYKNEISLSGTSRTAVQKIDTPITTKVCSVLGVSIEDLRCELLLENDSVVTVNIDILEKAVTDVDNLEELANDGPDKFLMKIQGTDVIDMNRIETETCVDKEEDN